jgi:hypothetical protein
MPTLMGAFNFTPADLDANQHGYMSKEQRPNLRKAHLRKLRLSLIIIGICASVLLLALVALVFRLGKPPESPLGLACALVALTTMTMTISLGTFHDWRQFDADLRKGEVSSISGRVSLRILGGSHPNVTCRLRIQSMELSVSEDQLLALKDGESYRVFFAPNSKVILSVESL